jgi:hypothetical protein
MSGDANMRRSQAIDRLPVDNQLAQLILHSGERSDVLLFLQPGEDITRLVSPGDPFVAMIKNAKFCLVARDVIAAIAVVTGAPPPDDDSLPMAIKRARIQLRSTTAIEGELRWIAAEGYKRTTDHLNDPASFLVVYAAETKTTYYIAKCQIAMVEELA